MAAAEALDETKVSVCDSWEDIDDSGLDQLLPPPARAALCKVDLLSEHNPTLGTQYMMPEPAIRILKREERLGEAPGGAETARRPVKTLEQRRREYEQARLRILGEARSPEDVIDDKLNRLQDKLQSHSISQPIRVKERPSAGAGAGVSSPRAPAAPGVLVLRAPRAPDGTRGFSAPR